MGKFVDLTGQRFGKLVVVEYVGKSKWLCKCDCGNEKIITRDNLKRQKSCGKCLYIRKDLTGMKFGRLTVIECVGQNKHRKSLWKCKCECGNEKIVCGSDLSGGNTKSCGCYNMEVRKSFTGEKSPNWKSELTDEYRSKERAFDRQHKYWSKEVREKANYTCDCCGCTDKQTHAHHLDDYDHNEDKRYDVENGVCICVSCHRKFHNYMKNKKHTDNCTAQDYYEWKEQQKK